MEFSFNAEIARRYGVEEAVFIHNLYWWVKKNKANGKHFYKGRYWTYNSMAAYSKLFPFWTKEQIRRIIKKLTAEAVLYVGNFNPSSYDRTQWYALGETITSIYENIEIHLDKSSNSKSDINTNRKQKGSPLPTENNDFLRFWESYPRKASKPAAIKAWKKLKPSKELIISMLAALEKQKQSEQWCRDGGQYIPYPATWLNGRRWEDEDVTGDSIGRKWNFLN